MEKRRFNYDQARQDGLTDEQITPFLRELHPDFDFDRALSEGGKVSDINDFLSSREESKPKERSTLEKGGRLAAQFGTGLIQAATPVLLSDIANIGTGSKGEAFQYRLEDLSDEYETLLDQKTFGDWTEKDEKRLAEVSDLITNRHKLLPTVEKGRINFDSQSLIEKATGLDLHPEGILEKGARFIGYLKNPLKLGAELKNIGTSASELVKSLVPGTKTFRALGAGTALEYAEEGQFGPVGTIAAAIVGDIIGHTPTTALNAVRNPKQTLDNAKQFAANTVNFLTRNNSKKEWIGQLVKDANELGLDIDAGTLTDSNLVKMLQARAAQSGLTGEALQNFKEQSSGQVVKKYKELADQLGELTFENNSQASEAINNALKTTQTDVPVFKEINRPARSLEGRIDVQQQPAYERQFLDDISPTEFHTDQQAAQALKAAAEDTKAPIKKEFNERFTNFREKTADIEGPQAVLVSDLENFVQDNRGSLLLGQSTAEARVVRAAEDLLERVNPGNSYRSVSLSDLIKTKQTLADVADYEFGGSNFNSKFKKIVSDLDTAIERTLQRASPQLLEEYANLNQEYSQFKQTFENKNVLPLFERRNNNYNSIYNKIVKNPDAMAAVEEMLSVNPQNRLLMNGVKRDFAERQLSKREITDRDYRNIAEVLGQEFNGDLAEYIQNRRTASENPTIRPGQRLGVDVPFNRSQGSSLTGRVSESELHKKRVLAKFLKGKDPDQVLRIMDSVEGIERVERVLNQTPEGKELYQELKRFKIEKMIGDKMKHELTDQLKSGVFSSLLESRKNRQIAKKLLGDQAYNQLRKLQKINDTLMKSQSRFINASQSGVTMADVSVIVTGLIGLFTGNPFMFLGSIGGVVSARTFSNLIADPKFLNYLEKAATAPNQSVFMKYLKKMEPSIQQAIQAETQIQ